MKHDRGWGFRGGAIATAVLGTFVACGTAQAQTAGGTAPPAAGADLRQQLSDLASNPQSVNELIATGRAALALGDGAGALSFFTRADQLAGRDPRVKAGLAAANVRAGRPETALSLFAEAIVLGAPEAELRADRGLAYDMVGQTARAQQDYLAALRSRDDAEVRRRLALSLAISGQREAALRLIEPQVQGGDRAGQRARIMVLALTGDQRGASAAASAALSAPQAASLSPFLSRLASLSPGEMAAAVNLGRVPSGTAVRQASARAPADPAALAFAGGGSAALPIRLPVAVAAATPRRRPGGVTATAAAPTAAARDRTMVAARDAGRPRGEWNTASSTAMAATRHAAVPGASSAARLMQPHPHEPLAIDRQVLEQSGLALPQASGPRVPAARAVEATAQPADVSAARPVQLAMAQPPEPQPQAAEEPADGAASNLAVWNGAAAPARVETSAPAAARSRPAPVEASPRREVVAPAPVTRREPASAPAPARRNFSDVAASVSALPAETARPAPARATARPATTRGSTSTTTRGAASPAATRAAATRTPAAPPRAAHPARIWVQLGVSNNAAGFNYELTRMRRLAPELARQTAYTAPLGSNHRLLVGPFPTDAAARTFINTLRQKDIQSMAWTSGAGTQVERLPPAR